MGDCSNHNAAHVKPEHKIVYQYLNKKLKYLIKDYVQEKF